MIAEARAEPRGTAEPPEWHTESRLSPVVTDRRRRQRGAEQVASAHNRGALRDSVVYLCKWEAELVICHRKSATRPQPLQVHRHAEVSSEPQQPRKHAPLLKKPCFDGYKTTIRYRVKKLAPTRAPINAPALYFETLEAQPQNWSAGLAFFIII